MDGLVLLRRAREAGLAVEAEGGKLVIRGPKRAEHVAQLLIEHKPEVLAALAPVEHWAEPVEQNGAADGAEATLWRDRFSARLVHWFRGDRRWGEAEQFAYGELILEWHKRHGARPDPRRCAGCGDKLDAKEGLLLCDNATVHFDGNHGAACLTFYGQNWRCAAVAGLQVLGLYPPEGFTLL
jgi:hypothetical protein